MATRTYKSYRNDFSRLRIFFGPICEFLKLGIPSVLPSKQTLKSGFDKYAGKHVKAEFLEDITASRINRFITARIEHDNWSAKTANLMRQMLDKLFNYAIKHHNFCSRDRRYPKLAASFLRLRMLLVIRFDKQRFRHRSHMSCLILAKGGR